MNQSRSVCPGIFCQSRMSATSVFDRILVDQSDIQLNQLSIGIPLSHIYLQYLYITHLEKHKLSNILVRDDKHTA